MQCVEVSVRSDSSPVYDYLSSIVSSVVITMPFSPLLASDVRSSQDQASVWHLDFASNCLCPS